MDNLENYVEEEVLEWLQGIKQETPDPKEVNALTITVARKARQFVSDQIANYFC